MESQPKSEVPDVARRFGVRLVTNPVSTWLIKKNCAPLAPILFKATNGRWSPWAGRPKA